MTKITELTSLAAAASGDEVAIVDADASETKRLTVGNMLRSVPAGSAASPSIAFVGDTDTGLFSTGTNELGFVTGGSERVTLDASGQMGIGVTSPDGTLHVHSASAGTIAADTNADELVVEGSGDTGITILGGNSSNCVINFGDDGDANIGVIDYDHANNTMTVTAGAEALLTISTGGVTADGVLCKDGHIDWDKAADVASATTTDIWATTGMVIDITGTTTITDFADAPSAGASRYLQFDGVLTLTHGSGITLPGAANITTAAGDTCMVYADTTTAFKVAWYQRAANLGGGDLVDDTTPQLGGDLDLNGNNIDFPTTANISDCLDEDDMASNSATVLATQQSIKAYVDNTTPQGNAAHKTDTFTISSATMTDITGLSIAITPRSTSSTILVLFTGTVGGSSTAHIRFQLVRDSTPIHIGDTASNRVRVGGANAPNAGGLTTSMAIAAIDSPATASSVTYKVQMAVNTGSAYLNRSSDDTDNNTHERGASSIIVMEVV